MFTNLQDANRKLYALSLGLLFILESMLRLYV